MKSWHIIALAGVLGAINAFDIPARQSFVIELVGPKHLPNAIALNSTGFNVARVTGPAIGGLLVAMMGEGTCFLLNAISYIAVLVGLLLIPASIGAGRRTTRGQPAALRAGLRYALASREVGWILGLVGVVSAIAVPYRNFLPVMARDVLHVGAWRYGLLMASAGAGAGLGGFILAGLQLRRETYQRMLPIGLVFFSVTLAAFAMCQSYNTSLLLLTLVGCGGIVYFNCSNTLVQLSVDDEYRGRVLALYTFMHQGTATFGSLALGLVAARFSTPLALLGGALLCAAATAVFSGVRPFAVAVPGVEARPAAGNG